MGYTNIFYVDETAIRKWIFYKNKTLQLITRGIPGASSAPVTDTKNIEDPIPEDIKIESLIDDIGLCLGNMLKDGNATSYIFYEEDKDRPMITTFNPLPPVHSQDMKYYLWEKDKLYEVLSKDIAKDCDSFAGRDSIILPLTSEEKEEAISKKRWDNKLAAPFRITEDTPFLDKANYYSIYTISELSFKNNYRNKAKLGEAFLNMMLSDWFSSISGLNSVLTIKGSDCTCLLLWQGNCLNIVPQPHSD